MKYLRSISATSMILLLFAFTMGCKTTSPTVRINKKRSKITVLSATDKNSSLAKTQGSDQINDAIKVLREKLKKDPGNSRLLLDLARALLLKGSYDKARTVCRKAVGHDLKNKGAKKLLAEIELASGNTSIAEIILNTIQAGKTKDSEILNLLGLINVRRKRYDEAFGLFSRGLRQNPDDVAIRMNLGTLHLKFRQFADATIQFRKVLGTMPGHVDARLHLGIAQAGLGQYERASVSYHKVIETNARNPLAWYNLALSQKQLGNLTEGRDAVRRYLRLGLSAEKEAEGQKLLREFEVAIKSKSQKQQKKPAKSKPKPVKKKVARRAT